MAIKKILCLVIAIFMIAAMLYSCSDNKDKNESGDTNNTTANPDDNQTQDPTEDDGYTYNGQKLDFNGEKFTILYYNYLDVGTYFAEEYNGDALNDALYRRTIDAEEYFHITMDSIMTNDVAASLAKDVLAGDNSYDIALPYLLGLNSIITQNLAYNWQKMPNVNLSKKYWNQSMVDGLTINGYTPLVVNDYLIPLPTFITFSKDLVKEYSLESPYTAVKEGKWTWDKVIEMSRQVSKDLDGDGQYTDADLYGFVCEVDWRMDKVSYSCAQPLVKRDDDGRYVLAVNTERMQTITDKMYDLLYKENSSFAYPYGAKTVPFDSGRALFYMYAPKEIVALRSTNFDFGLLPYPKLDENQKDYIDIYAGDSICAPANIENPEKVGAVMEYLAAMGRKSVWPAYFDILLIGKVINDEESRDMLDIIYNSSIFDFGFTFKNDFYKILPNMLLEKSTGVASYYEKRADAVQRQIDVIYDAFVANSEGN